MVTLCKPSAAAKAIGYFTMVGIMILLSSCAYMKMNPPADADKAFSNNSCWLAAAANMLAGAGYGNGTTVQDRADDIYGNLTSHFGTANRGWMDTALDWWLSSSHNVWPNNPYTIATVFGTKLMDPWANPNGPRDLGNQLRECNFVSLTISWPTVDASVGSGGHAITGWGDGRWFPWTHYRDPLTTNPSKVRVTDSDRDAGGDVQEYRYDAYTNPNPGGPNEGPGWYINYDPNHPYLRNIITLSPTRTAGGTGSTVRVVGSYRIHQVESTPATDLHYKVSTDVPILTYLTRNNWLTELTPKIVEYQNHEGLVVDWDFKDAPVPQCTWVTITTEFILRSWNAMWYDDVSFTYPGMRVMRAPKSVAWEIHSPTITQADTIRNVTGGYVLGAFRILNPALPPDSSVVAEYRLMHQYSYTQSPEQHTFALRGSDGYLITDLRFGHSYGYLDPDSLWTFQEWMTQLGDSTFALSSAPVQINIDWSGRLPYPDAGDIKDRIPEIKRKVK
jgi:hypothetical protein